MSSLNGLEVAVIGMSGRFPGARNIEEFWQLLKSGKEGISSFSDKELLKAGVTEELLAKPEYVRKHGVMAGKECFDVELFDYNAREATVMDPQFCMFHECVWEALEKAGYETERYSGLIGIYAGASNNREWLIRVMQKDGLMADDFSLTVLTAAELLCTRIAYAFNLKGPAIYLQSACSTSLVATHMACQGLLAGECDIALAGGVSIVSLENMGYLYQDGMILSPDGACRTFDANANGTVWGDGCGVLVLKLLENALEDRDNILAVIKGSAINNDGCQKVGYTAPGVEGQLQVIRDAQQKAEVLPESISYIEAHGTATKLGDPIEIQALTQAFGAEAVELKGKGYCKIGAVKSNIGHLDIAAGVASMIKTILALQHKQIPPSLHFNTPNPHIAFDNSPFRVSTELCDWESQDSPRRAGVSSFGIGGTNAHVVIEEACFENETSESRIPQMMFLSANSETALDRVGENLLQYIEKFPTIYLADLCYTLQVGRKLLPYRKAFVVKALDELKATLSSAVNNTINSTKKADVFTGKIDPENRNICFLFPGQGSQMVNMGKDLYENEAIFREWLDKCFTIAQHTSEIDFKQHLFPRSVSEQSTAALNQTVITQPILFMFEYSLAQLLMHWGCRPNVMIGHSVGEYVAACLAGVFSLEDGIALIIQRGALVQTLPAGAMLSVLAPVVTIEPLLNKQLCIAAINSPERLVISGEEDAIHALQETLDQQNIQHTRLHTSHAFHSHHMEPILDRFQTVLEKVRFSSPKTPFLSNVSGDKITTEQAMSPAYWVQHLRQCVQFSEGITQLCEQSKQTFVEVGPGRVLSTFVLQNSSNVVPQACIALLSDTQLSVDKKTNSGKGMSYQQFLMMGLCQLFVAGKTIDWKSFYADEKRRRVALPGYPFEGKNYRTAEVLPPTAIHGRTTENCSELKRKEINNWYHIPFWSPASPPKAFIPSDEQTWLILMDDQGIGEQLVQRLSSMGKRSINIFLGDEYQQNDSHTYVLNPFEKDNYIKMFAELEEQKRLPSSIIHLWGIEAEKERDQTKKVVTSIADKKTIKLGYYSQIYLAQAFGHLSNPQAIVLKIVANNTQKINSYESIIPEKAINVAPSRVIPDEYPFVSCQYIDCHLEEVIDGPTTNRISPMVDELLTIEVKDPLVAYRNNSRWVQDFKEISLPPGETQSMLLRGNGNYLITGGLGGLGLLVAKYLAEQVQGTLILLARSKIPTKKQWSEWLSSHTAEDATTKKIRSLQELESLGAKVIIVNVDIADTSNLKKRIITLVKKVGNIHGVFNTAGIASQGAIQLKQDNDIENALSAKVIGSFNLRNLISPEHLDFMVFFSSLAALTGGEGEIDYCAGNLFLDAFAQEHDKRRGTRYLSINWPAWKETGMATNVKLPEHLQNAYHETLQEMGITTEEGMEVFIRLFDSGISPQIAISHYPISVFLEKPDAYKNFGENGDAISRTTHARPDSSIQYVESQTDTEKKLVSIWAQMLGLDRVGIEDNIFHLGADSLLCIRVSSQIRETFEIEFSLENLFELPTVHLQADRIDYLSGGTESILL